MSTLSSHIPVLLEESMATLGVEAGYCYVDCTLGGGGHARAILERSAPGGRLLGIDADPLAIETVRACLRPYGGRATLVNENFNKLEEVCASYRFTPVKGVFFDLGLSSLQLEEDRRGFSFQRNAPLDMRLSPEQEVTAADIVNNLSEAELAEVLEKYGEEPRARQIARRIVEGRPLSTTLELVQAVTRAVGRARGRIHQATRTFQALRIAVNRELENLESALRQAIRVLGLGGRLVVISYHSLEDRLVKDFLRREARDCLCPPRLPTCVCGHRRTLKPVTKGAVRPSAAEIEENPRSRSAKMRAAELLRSPAS